MRRRASSGCARVAPVFVDFASVLEQLADDVVSLFSPGPGGPAVEGQHHENATEPLILAETASPEPRAGEDPARDDRADGPVPDPPSGADRADAADHPAPARLDAPASDKALTDSALVVPRPGPVRGGRVAFS